MTAGEALRVTVAINPNASFGRNREVGPRVVETIAAAGHDVTMLREPNFELLRRETAHAVAAGTDALVVVGGDGMVSLGTNLVAGTDIPLGIVPSGTGNDMARGLGLPVGDTEAAIARARRGPRREPRSDRRGHRAARRARHLVRRVLSAGFDAVVNERANTMTRPRGASRYILALLRELVTLKPVQLPRRDRRRRASSRGHARLRRQQRVARRRHEGHTGCAARRRPARRLHRQHAVAARVPAGLPEGLLGDAHDASRGRDRARRSVRLETDRRSSRTPTGSGSARFRSISSGARGPAVFA